MSYVTELAWAAGFFDGEGSTVFHTGVGKRGPKASFSISVGQSGDGPAPPETLVRFMAAVGFGRINGPYTSPRYKIPAWQWQAHGADAEAVLNRLWKYLSGPKRAQASGVLTQVANLRRMHNG